MDQREQTIFRRIATRLEDCYFNGAGSQVDYLTRVSRKVLLLAAQLRNSAGPSSSTLATDDSSLPLDLEPAVDTGDQRFHLPLDSRKKNAMKIMETLRKHVPNCGEEGNMLLIQENCYQL